MVFARASSIKVEIYRDMKDSNLTFLYHFCPLPAEKNERKTSSIELKKCEELYQNNDMFMTSIPF